jgi:uncharacterized protein
MRRSKTKHFAAPIVLVTIYGLLIGCSSSPPSRYYTLEEQLTTTIQVTAEPLAVRVGPIRMARYIDRPQIVTRIQSNELKVAEYDRWIEPLDQSFQRILTNNLADNLSSPLVYEFGAGASGDMLINYQVLASVMRFDVDQNNIATLDVQWTLTGRKVDHIYLAQRTVFTVEADSKSYSDRAAAMSTLIAEFAQDIAERIVQVNLAAANGAASISQ